MTRNEPPSGAASAADAEVPPFRYTAAMAERIELAWQDRWEAEGTFHTPNPTGPLSAGFDAVAERPKLYVNDMFPYPSGAGLHVGHPLGYIGTDVYARYQRMNGHSVLHTMGYDAFGLPAEQYAVETGQQPQSTTEANVATYRRQLRRLGLGHDTRRSVSTTDVGYYRWTQWIFLQVFGSWFDVATQRARPIAELEAELDAGTREPAVGTNPSGLPWAELTGTQRREVVNEHRLAYIAEAMVNWCPGLGTVLANEEVTAEGRSDRGNFPVYRRPLRQWMMRITSFADRLLADLDRLDWPESVKLMQRNWIGRSVGARVNFATAAGEGIEVFTTRPDTLFGATYMVLAPEHPLVDELTPGQWPDGTAAEWSASAATPTEAVAAYREWATHRTDLERQAEAKVKTGVFTGAFATNPVTGAEIPVFVADYVLMGYGTGAIMAVPGQDQRDWDFAVAFALPIVRTVQPPQDFAGEAFTGDGPAINSAVDGLDLDGADIATAKARMLDWLEVNGNGSRAVTYKLRDWLFSRQRYWGEPFPIVYGPDGLPRALPASALPVVLPPTDDFSPRTSEDENSEPEPPLGRLHDWVTVTLDLGDGPQEYRREVNTMPQWAGSCWYELRYLDPTNDEVFVDPEVERYWMGPRFAGDTGGVDLYVGGVEHAVLHLLYARFWHKVLFDLGHLSSEEPFRRLFNQGYVQAYAYRDARGLYVEAAEVTETDGQYSFRGEPVRREFGKMGKSLKNSVTPDDMYAEYGADTLRLYEMFTGPMDQSRPWETRAVVGSMRLIQRIWRVVVDEQTGVLRTTDVEAAHRDKEALHQALERVRDGMETLRFNIAIAKITELTNYLTQQYPAGEVPRELAEPLVLMLAPLAPHVAEALWQRLGHNGSLAWETFPEVELEYLVRHEIDYAIQVNGKVRAGVTVSPDADAGVVEAAARADKRIAGLLTEGTVRKVIFVPGRLVNFVVSA
ncbi:MAG: leucine--tRNA ligase [Geodermatophilaceae bacterium]|nr:leucine--tRNA ligase [Geodermatophilaceae bacterium]